MPETVTNWFGDVVSCPKVVVDAHTVQDIVNVLTNPAQYPSPVRAVGSNHSTTACGTAERGTLAAKFRVGELDYALGGHPLWEIFRTAYQMWKKPYLVGGLMLLAGYVAAGMRGENRPVSDELVKFRRREQMARLKRFLTRGRAPQPHLPAGSE